MYQLKAPALDLASSVDLASELGLETCVIGYIRVSTREQLDSNSFEEQAASIESWCQAKGYRLVAIYYDAESGSKLTERAGLTGGVQRARTDSDIDGIVFYDFDRFFRDVGYSEMIRKALRQKGKQIYSTLENIDFSTPEGELQFQIKQTIAEYQRKSLVRLMYTRRMAKAKKGGYAGGRVPYGKRVIQHELVDDPGEQYVVRLVRRVRKWVKVDGKPATQQWISEYLNAKLTAEIATIRADEAFMRSIACLGSEKQYELICGRCRTTPKHMRPLQKARRRPYVKPRSMQWTRNHVAAILDNEGVIMYPTRAVPRPRNGTGTSPDPSLKQRHMQAYDLIIGLAAKGFSSQQIARFLTEQHIPTATGKKVWKYTAVSKLLSVLQRQQELAG